MIKIPVECGVAHIIQNSSELPDISQYKEVYLDVETNSFNPKEGGLLPYNGHRIAGIAISGDDNPDAFYIPICHQHNQWNLRRESIIKWLQTLTATRWINHNIKFDAHFLAQEEFIFDGEMVDTLTLAKCHDSDRQGHGLKELGRDWLGLQTQEQTRVDAFLKGARTKNFADVPGDILGEYACSDVLMNRFLFQFLIKNRPEELAGIWNTEIKLTSVLFDMERKGMRINKIQVKKEIIVSLKKLIDLSTKIQLITGREFVDSQAHLFDVLVNQFSFPILAYSEDTGAPSFDGATLEMYSIHPEIICDETKKTLNQLIMEYREEAHFKGLFLDAYNELSDANGYLHPSYNQVVRTGRMSCRNPNSQQLNKRAKALILPDPGKSFLSADASQIEFRIMVHYINDAEAIAAYTNDPTTDFHQWVANICRIQRKQAKNINFAIGYGAGKKKVTSMLRNDPSIMKEIGEQIDVLLREGKITESDRTRVYAELCENRANEIYHEYHQRLPGIRRMSNTAATKCRIRGWVFNAFGRRRHLPAKFAHRAFNSVVQGCAMDYIKDRMIDLSHRFNQRMRELDLFLLINVHDELVFHGPTEIVEDPTVQKWVLDQLQIQPIPFRVPFHWKMGHSKENWAKVEE